MFCAPISSSPTKTNKNKTIKSRGQTGQTLQKKNMKKRQFNNCPTSVFITSLVLSRTLHRQLQSAVDRSTTVAGRSILYTRNVFSFLYLYIKELSKSLRVFCLRFYFLFSFFFLFDVFSFRGARLTTFCGFLRRELRYPILHTGLVLAPVELPALRNLFLFKKY